MVKMKLIQLRFSLGTENMVRRNCRDCPVPNCGAKYLVRLANHLTDVHLLGEEERRKYLQLAKLQPKVKFVEYQNTTDENNGFTKRSPQNVYKVSLQRSQPISRKAKKGNKMSFENECMIQKKRKRWLKME